MERQQKFFSCINTVEHSKYGVWHGMKLDGNELERASDQVSAHKDTDGVSDFLVAALFLEGGSWTDLRSVFVYQLRTSAYVYLRLQYRNEKWKYNS
jgi:hypothetical protein